MKIWQLKKGFDRRFRAGHPWVYSNELQGSPKGVEAGELIELRDAGGTFLAYGYGNSQSLIAFRVLSRDAAEKDFAELSGIERKLRASLLLRENAGFKNTSHRLCFGEADLIPGLVIDRYRLNDGSDFCVIQAHSAGADRLLPVVEKALTNIFKDGLGLIVRKDMSVRKLEGLEVGSFEIKKTAASWNDKNLRKAPIQVRSVIDNQPHTIFVDLLEGQKTGFFLDQWGNIRALSQILKNLQPRAGAAFTVLDLCSYVGQWPVQLISLLEKNKFQVDFTCVDASESALEFTQSNFANLKSPAKFATKKADVLKDLKSSVEGKDEFDLVIADPPAFIKSKKDAPQGKHAYLQLFTDSIRLTKKGGFIVACSCSALFTEEEFAEALSKAARRNSADIRWVSRGELSPDHPFKAEFPEGRYLKCWIGQRI